MFMTFKSCRNVSFCAFRPIILASLLFVSAPAQQRQRGLKIIPPPPPVGAATYKIGSYNIHIFENPGARSRNPAERSVLLLGTFSDPSAVLNSRNYINPATGRRFEVVIGLGADNIGDEARRVVLEDHFNADRNAAAMRSAIVQHFGGPLVAGTLDTHSNGTTVGISGILQGALRDVKKVNVLGPDIGYGGTYLNKESLGKLKQAGVEAVDIYRNRGDIIPALGQMSALLGNSIPGVSAATQAVKSLQALMEVATEPRGSGLPEVRQFELQTSFGIGFTNHYVENYLNTIAGFVKDPGAATPIANGPQDAKGVRIFIDDEILAKALAAGTAQENEQLFDQLAKQIQDGREESEINDSLASFSDTLKLRFKRASNAAIDNVVLVSLRSILEPATAFVSRWNDLPENLKHPGGITRIHGYLLSSEKDDVLLIGARNNGEPPIELDDLIVGISAVWKEGKVPFCSLDPDPEDVAGPQKVRLDGIPTDSGFALKMLNADYTMKKIMFGIEPVDIPGYQSYRSIIASQTTGKDSTNRFWLYPLQPQAGEIEISADGKAALFTGGAQVLSEQMVQTRSGFAGTGMVDAQADEAAASFTRHYTEIAKSKPEFQQLQSLFDIVLLARIWQHNNLKSALLDLFTQLPHGKVAIPATYSGQRVEIPNGGNSLIILSGGVQAKTNSGARSMLAFQDPELTSILERAREMPAGVPAFRLAGFSLNVIVPDRSNRDNVNLAVSAAMGKVAVGDSAGAKRVLEKAIRTNPFDPEPLAVRSFVDFISGDIAAARADAFVAQQMDPDNPDITTITAIVLFQCDALEGKTEAAMEKIDWAIRNDASSVRSRILRAEALIQLERPTEARQELVKATQMDPTSALALARLGILELGEGWTTRGRKLITRAYAMSKALDQDGPEIKVALALAEMSAAAFGNVKTQLAVGERIANEALAHPACDPRSALVALLVLSGSAMIAENWEKAEVYMAQAKERVPFSPELLLFATEMAFDAKRDDLAQKYLAEAERMAPYHPAVKALRQKIGR